VTASEFAFLSLGLLLGVLSGAALIEVLRSRPPAPREVRLTVTPGSIPRRGRSTLSEDAFLLPGPAGAHGGPADRRQAGQTDSPGPATRTAVRSPLGPAGAGDPASSLPISRLAAAAPPASWRAISAGVGSAVPALGGGPGLRPSAVAPGIAGGAIAIPVYREVDWTLQALRSAAASVAERAMHDQRLTAAAILEPPTASPPPTPERAPASGRRKRRAAASRLVAHGGPDPAPVNEPARAEATAEPGSAGAAGAPEMTTPVDSGPPGDPAGECAEIRRVAEERCAVAGIARKQAETAHAALRAAQRSYDDHHARAEAASAAADPRAIRTAKDAAQQAFRTSRAAAVTLEAVEAAAREWLTEINGINGAAREASTAVARERESANALVLAIERLTVEADAARIAAEAAGEACVVARQAVADCDEAEASREAMSAPGAPAGSTQARDGWNDESELEAAFTATGVGEPAILRLLRGDHATLGRLVGQLAGEDPVERRRWQLALAGLVDAVVARAIEASTLTFPLEDSFWGAFSLAQNREIVAALSSLGYRFDGLGGWADGRVPTQRDLSLAVGYAGLDPKRIRPWPGDEELAGLFADVAVAADEYLADAAGGLTLGELVSVLGRRADGLADLWNEWGRVRPLLLAGAA
jgi:hypothetical protein